ncbi:MAG: hypothetical protein AAF902_17925, partial [Chloroflexota bacterium]
MVFQLYSEKPSPSPYWFAEEELEFYQRVTDRHVLFPITDNPFVKLNGIMLKNNSVEFLFYRTGEVPMNLFQAPQSRTKNVLSLLKYRILKTGVFIAWMVVVSMFFVPATSADTCWFDGGQPAQDIGGDDQTPPTTEDNAGGSEEA